MSYDDYDDEPITTRVPLGVRVAGIIWIVFGALALVTMIFIFTQAAMGKLELEGISEALCCLSALLFIWAGSRTVSGKAKGVLGNSIGSIIVSLLFFGMGTIFTLLGTGIISLFGPGRILVQALLTGLISFLLGGLLISASILAIINRQAYLNWKHHNKPL